MPRLFKHKGFSLFEISVVLVLITLVSMISYPYLHKLLQRTKANSVLAQLIQAINIARTQSRVRHLPIAVCESNDSHHCSNKNGNYLLVFINENEDGVIKDDEQLLATFKLEQGILYSRLFPFYRHYLLFLSNGIMQSDNASFWYCFSQTEKPAWALILNQAGRLRIVYPDEEGNVVDSHDKKLIC